MAGSPLDDDRGVLLVLGQRAGDGLNVTTAGVPRKKLQGAHGNALDGAQQGGHVTSRLTDV